MFLFFLFLVADTQLYKRLCPSVHQSVRPSVSPGSLSWKVCAGWRFGCGWGLDAPARPSAMILWPRVTCFSSPCSFTIYSSCRPALFSKGSSFFRCSRTSLLLLPLLLLLLILLILILLILPFLSFTPRNWTCLKIQEVSWNALNWRLKTLRFGEGEVTPRPWGCGELSSGRLYLNYLRG